MGNVNQQPVVTLSKIGGCQFCNTATGHPVFEIAARVDNLHPNPIRFHMECLIEQVAETAMNKWQPKGYAK